MRQNLVAFVVGVVFAIGLGLAGMTQPSKVIGFLDPFAWDPSLLFVMVGAIGVHALAYPLVRRRSTPLFSTRWRVPTQNDLSPRLFLGAAIFGIGWGLGGFCPGPGVALLASGEPRALGFVGAMLGGMIVVALVQRGSTGSRNQAPFVSDEE